MDRAVETTLARWTAETIITAEQRSSLALQPAEQLEATMLAIEAALPVRARAPDAFSAALEAILKAQPPPPSTPSTTIDEVVVVVVDVSGSMQTPFEVDDGRVPADAENQNARTVNRTRLDAMKQVFYGFRDATTTFGGGGGARHLLGLVSFCNTVTVHTAPTDNFDVFEDVVDDMRAGGQTAIYEAIEKACALLAPARAAHPAADLRVVCLSDGQNNCRRVGAEQALAALDALGATCDALLVGDSVDDALRRLVAATEGECFEIDCLARAFETLESPAVVSLAARRNGAPKPAPRAATAKPRELAAVAPKPPRRGALAAAPPPPPPPAARVDEVVPLAAFVARGDAGTRAGVQKRLAKELARVATDCTTAACDVALGADGAVLELRARLNGAGAYAGRAVDVAIAIPRDYPFSAPRATIRTPMYHYAVSTEGQVCLPLLREGWSPARSVGDALHELRSLLFEYATFDPTAELSQRSWLSELLRVEPEQYFEQAKEHAAQHAPEAASAPAPAAADEGWVDMAAPA